MVIQHTSAENLLDIQLRFGASTFGRFVEQAREEAQITQEDLCEKVNELIKKKNEDLSKKDKIPTLNLRIYGNLVRHERFPAYEEFEPIYRALSELLPEPFSQLEREHYLALAQTRFEQRRRRPKKVICLHLLIGKSFQKHSHLMMIVENLRLLRYEGKYLICCLFHLHLH